VFQFVHNFTDFIIMGTRVISTFLLNLTLGHGIIVLHTYNTGQHAFTLLHYISAGYDNDSHLVLISLAMLKKTHKQLLFGDKVLKTLHECKDNQCLPNPSQHLPIYVQLMTMMFPSYSNRKCKKSPFSRTAAHIFVSSGDAPAIIRQYVAWMERQFNVCQTPRSMYLSIFNSFRVIRYLSRCVSPKIAIFNTFLFPLGTPLGQSR